MQKYINSIGNIKRLTIFYHSCFFQIWMNGLYPCLPVNCLPDDEILQRISALAFEGLNGWSTDPCTAKNTSLRTEVSYNALQCETILFPQKTGFFFQHQSQQVELLIVSKSTSPALDIWKGAHTFKYAFINIY